MFPVNRLKRTAISCSQTPKRLKEQTLPNLDQLLKNLTPVEDIEDYLSELREKIEVLTIHPGFTDFDALRDYLSGEGRYVTRLDLRGLAITDDQLRFVVETCPMLDSLSLCASKLTDAGFASLCPMLQPLRELTLDECQSLSEESIRAIGWHLSKLNSLSIKGPGPIEAVSLRTLVESLPLLRSFELA